MMIEIAVSFCFNLLTLYLCYRYFESKNGRLGDRLVINTYWCIFYNTFTMITIYGGSKIVQEVKSTFNNITQIILI